MREHHIAVGRTARYAVLGAAAEPATHREVWFVLHGYGQLAATFVRQFEVLDNGTRLIVAPEALNRFYLVDVASAPASERPVGATWMTREDRQHEIHDYIAYLDALWRSFAATISERTPPRVTVLGFSQGTATAARWAALGAARPADLVLWGGLLPPDPDIVAPSSRLRQMRLRFVIGSRDNFVSDARLAEEELRLKAAGLDYSVDRYIGGHRIKHEPLLELARSLGTTGLASRESR